MSPMMVIFIIIIIIIIIIISLFMPSDHNCLCYLVVVILTNYMALSYEWQVKNFVVCPHPAI
jgi:hypothetical protein